MAQNVDILRMMDELHELVVDRPRSVLGKLTWGLNKDEASLQIYKIKASMPAELKQASAKVRESEKLVEGAREDANQTVEQAQREAERLLTEARAEAGRIVEQAKLQQDRMITESEVLKIAKAQAEELRNSADRESTQLRRNAERYAYDVLCQLEHVVGKVSTTIDRGKQELEHPVEAALPGRDRARG